MRTVAFDGCNSLRVPDTECNRSWLGRIRYRMGFAGYPTLRMMTLIETGTRGMIGAVLGSAADRDEATLARRLLWLLHPGMVVLLDRAFDAAAFLNELNQTGARFLVRSRSTRRPPVLTHLPDGSFLSNLHGLSVRIIDAELSVTGTDGSRVRDRYRLITTLLDHDRHPAAELIRLYHERWEIEIAYLALRHTILNGHVLRSQDRLGLEQEVWALLTVYQLLRMAMVTAVESRPDTNPDRASFTTALQTARDQLIAAHGILPTDQPGQSGRPDLLGAIGRAVLTTLLPPRRPRWSTRRLKNATSRYLNRDDKRPHLPSTIASIQVILHTPSLDKTWRPRHRKPRNPNAAPTRRETITALMEDDPSRPWRGRELADKLSIKPRNMLTQLAEWTRLGFLTRTHAGTYLLPTRRDTASP
jgi:Transposase DDE domain